MFGVPTFCVGDRAVFVRLMERNVPDDIDRCSNCSRSSGSTSSSTRASRGSVHADVGHRSGDVGGREGPRAPLRLLQPHDPRSRARREAAAPDARPRARRDSRGCAQRVVSPPLRLVPPEFADDPASTSTTTCAASRSRRRATCARCSTCASNSPRVRSTGRARCGSSRVHRRARRTAGPRSCRRSTTRSATVSAALKLSLALLDFEPDPDPSRDGTDRRSRTATPAARGPIDVLRRRARATRRRAQRRRGAHGTSAARRRARRTRRSSPRRATDTVHIAAVGRAPGVRRRPARSDLLARAVAAPPLRGALGVAARV